MLYRSNPPYAFVWNLEMDLNADLGFLLKEDMKKKGISQIGQRDPLYEYFNLKKRTISIRPRRIVQSREFEYPQEYEQALGEFENAVMNGKNLNVYLTDSITTPAKSDALLYDWNIVHFHLTRRFREDGFAQRSNYQIFAWVTDDCLYMIQTYPHSMEYLYSQQEMLRIIEENWPQLLAPYRLHGVANLSEVFNDEEYSKLRKANVSTLVQTRENHVYGFMGGGYMSDGSSGEARRNANFWKNHLHICEQIIKDNMNNIISAIQSARGDISPDFEIRLVKLPINADEMTVVEVRNFMGIQLLMKQKQLRIYRIEEEFR